MLKVEQMIQNAESKGFKLINASIDGMFFANTLIKRTIMVSWCGGWEHVSMNDLKFDPSWSDMCQLKDMFWNDDETVVQYHPAKSEYVNNLKHCLHLWKPIEQFSGKLPIPPSEMVGIKGLELN